MSRFIRYPLIVIFCFFAIGAEAKNQEPRSSSGFDIVHDIIPELAQAAENVLGLKEAGRFFHGWTEDEALLFLTRFKEFFRDRTNHADDLAQAYEQNQDHIIGVFGEIFGAAKLRQEIKDSGSIPAGAVFVNELSLDPSKYIPTDIPNEYRRRHDGIVFSLTSSGDLIVYKILEGKMSGNYDRKQAGGVLERWRSYGVHLNNKLFPPDKVFLATGPQGGKLIPIRYVGQDMFERATLVAGSVQRSHNLGCFTYYQIPFSLGKSQDNLSLSSDERNYVFNSVGKELARIVSDNSEHLTLVELFNLREAAAARKYAYELITFNRIHSLWPSLENARIINTEQIYLALRAGVFPHDTLPDFLSAKEQDTFFKAKASSCRNMFGLASFTNT